MLKTNISVREIDIKNGEQELPFVVELRNYSPKGKLLSGATMNFETKIAALYAVGELCEGIAKTTVRDTALPNR